MDHPINLYNPNLYAVIKLKKPAAAVAGSTGSTNLKLRPVLGPGAKFRQAPRVVENLNSSLETLDLAKKNKNISETNTTSGGGDGGALLPNPPQSSAIVTSGPQNAQNKQPQPEVKSEPCVEMKPDESAVELFLMNQEQFGEFLKKKDNFLNLT